MSITGRLPLRVCLPMQMLFRNKAIWFAQSHRLQLLMPATDGRDGMQMLVWFRPEACRRPD